MGLILHFLPMILPGSTTTWLSTMQSSPIMVPMGVSSFLNSLSISMIALPDIVEKLSPMMHPFPMMEWEIWALDAIWTSSMMTLLRISLKG